MADIINDALDDEDGNQSQQVAPQDQKQNEPPKDDIPEKYRGKTPAEIARMHAELEHLVGRQGAELGELRRTHDEFIRSTLAQARGGQKAEVPNTDSTDDDAEFFINPRKAIKKLLSEDTDLRNLRTTVQETVQERNQRLFRAKHSDADQVLADAEFRAWVQKSPLRTGLLLRAHQQYDVQAGDELFSAWKELQEARGGGKQQQDQQQQPDKDTDAARRDAVRAGTIPSGNANAGSGDGGKKVYRRADLIRLQQTDPEKYAAMGDEILLAYAEKRVK
jgi:hypothetical protein